MRKGTSFKSHNKFKIKYLIISPYSNQKLKKK